MKYKMSIYFTTSDQPLETFLPVPTAQILTFGARQPAEILIVRILKYKRGRTVLFARCLEPQQASSADLPTSDDFDAVGVAGAQISSE